MASIIDEEIEDLKKTLLDMTAAVDSMMEKSIALICDPADSKSKISEIKAMDDEVDSMEVDLDGKCVRLLGLYAPEAEMLRTVVAVMKINNDVERIGDHAVNIARLVGKSGDFPPFPVLPKAAEMGDKALEMFRMSVDAFINKRKDLALEVTKRDAEVDNLEKEVVNATLEYLKVVPESTPAATCVIVLARNLERAADLSTNIAEDTHYLVTGEVIKHA